MKAHSVTACMEFKVFNTLREQSIEYIIQCDGLHWILSYHNIFRECKMSFGSAQYPFGSARYLLGVRGRNRFMWPAVWNIKLLDCLCRERIKHRRVWPPLRKTKLSQYLWRTDRSNPSVWPLLWKDSRCQIRWSCLKTCISVTPV